MDRMNMWPETEGILPSNANTRALKKGPRGYVVRRSHGLWVMDMAYSLTVRQAILLRIPKDEWADLSNHKRLHND
jgi:hypothetical protein